MSRGVSPTLVVAFALLSPAAVGAQSPPSPSPTVESPASSPAPSPVSPAVPSPRLPPYAPDFVGRPGDADIAPPAATAAGTSDVVARALPCRTGELCFRPGLEVFGQYDLTLTSDGAGGWPWFHAFDVPRVHVSVDAAYEGMRARLVIEAVRSAGAGALIGVAGDSVLVRVREAYAGYTFFENRIAVRVGVVPDLTIAALESAWGLRAVATTPLEDTGLGHAADLGATATFTLPEHLGWLGAQVTNGDGYAQRELNRGKSTTAAAELHPLEMVPALRPLAVFASATLGSEGTGATQANRLTLALLWRDTRIAGGLSYTGGWGVGGDPTRDATLLDVFFRVEPVTNLLLGARFTYYWRSAQDGDAVGTFVGTVGWRFVEPLSVFFAVTRRVPGSVALAAVPGTDTWDFAVVARAFF